MSMENMHRPSSDYKLPLLLYDSECTFCKRFKEALEKLDRHHHLTMVSIHDEEIYQQFPELDKTKCHESVHILDENRQIHQGPDVVVYLAQKFPGVSKFAWLLETNMGQKAVDFFYNTVNELRKSQLNRCQSCKGQH